ncbi:MAG: hypothetical protein II973_12395 [Spirochaetaceae bacterium]|nr:hypothetical protein [Spirochaetaceae bacterium]
MFVSHTYEYTRSKEILQSQNYAPMLCVCNSLARAHFQPYIIYEPRAKNRA